jgi:hydrogenase maturation factor
MCITRVGQVLSLEGTRANVKYLDTGALANIDISMIDASKNSYVEIFANHAIGRISKREAETKRTLMRKLLKLAGQTE